MPMEIVTNQTEVQTHEDAFVFDVPSLMSPLNLVFVIQT